MNVRTRRWLALVTLAAATIALTLLVGGCSSCQDEEVDAKLLASLANDKGIQIGSKLEDAEREEAARLVGKITHGRFPGRLVERERNAKLFLFLAAKSDKPEVIAASLRAMRGAFAPPGDKSRKPAADADYATVVVAHLKSKDANIVSEALAAAHNSLSGRPPNPAVLKEVMAMATSYPVDGGRIEAINALLEVPDYRRNPTVAATFVKVLDDKSPAVLSHALYYLYQSGADKIAQRAAFLEQGRKLLKHPDPGVRGRATKLVAALAPNDVELRNQIRAMLNDPHPYVRSIVPHSLVDLNDVAAIHLLVPKLTDLQRNNHHIRYTKLVGGRAAVAHGAKNETVHDTVARAIEALSAKFKEPFKRPGRKNDQASRDKNTPAAQAWYEKQKTEIPPLDAPPPSPEGSPDAQTDKRKEQAQPGKPAVGTVAEAAAKSQPAGAKPKAQAKAVLPKAAAPKAISSGAR